MIKESTLRGISLGAGAIAVVACGILVRVSVVHQQDPYCRQNLSNLITCGVASGQAPIQSNYMNGLVNMSGTNGTQQMVFAPNVNFEDTNLLISFPVDLEIRINEPQYLV